MNETVIAPIITALFGGIGVVIGAWAARRKILADANKVDAETRKVDAEADSAAIAAANAFIQMLHSEINQLKARVEGLEADVRRERMASYEINIKYHNALDRIVELEKETIVLRRQLGEAKVEIEKQRQRLDGAVSGSSKSDGTE